MFLVTRVNEEKRGNELLPIQWLPTQASDVGILIAGGTGSMLLGFEGLLDAYTQPTHRRFLGGMRDSFLEIFMECLVSVPSQIRKSHCRTKQAIS